MATKRFKIVPKENKTLERRCIACNGSGFYDVDGSPKCGACNGTGVEHV